jgi:hypothetical protein
LQAGWAWGRPRRGHPEGQVGNHVADLLRTIDEWGETGSRRAELRVLALVHDALKVEVDHSRSRTGANHHAMRARRLAERYIDDERVLDAIELHDAPYAIWKRVRRGETDGELALDRLIARISDHDLFTRFVELDGSTEGKDPEPTLWFKRELRKRREDRRGEPLESSGRGFERSSQ